MPDKIKVTQKEIDEMYDIETDTSVVQGLTKEDSNAEVSFEDFTENYDKEKDKKWRSDVGEEE